jgi:hypothetical protein
MDLLNIYHYLIYCTNVLYAKNSYSLNMLKLRVEKVLKSDMIDLVHKLKIQTVIQEKVLFKTVNNISVQS